MIRNSFDRSPSEAAGNLVPAPAVAAEFGITRRTLGRWFTNSKLQFPKPVKINERLYFRRADLEAWKLTRVCGPLGNA